jgi:SAM-dependent methyltransferase/uncharacterized protein YbaR (Trm112 family)
MLSGQMEKMLQRSSAPCEAVPSPRETRERAPGRQGEISLADLRCPVCRGGLSRKGNAYACDECAAAFPIVRGVPILIDESRSAYRIADCAARVEGSERPAPWTRRMRERVQGWLPTVGKNFAARDNLATFARMLRRESEMPRVLVLGGARLGVGCEVLAEDPAFALVECDVLFGPRTSLVCDAHQIPFADATFDAVVAQGVFEYLKDPFCVAAEIHRVLRPRGLVYAESPFMQQVHGGGQDLFRYTPAGHRLVFRQFEEVRSGMTAGPGTVLSWSCRYFLRSFADRAATRFLADIAASLTTSWLWRFDSFLVRRPSALSAASGVYFLGRRSDVTLTDRELREMYRGPGVMGY